MALSLAALTTPSVVFDELDIEDDAGVLRARVERYIEEASALVAAILSRPVHYDPAVVERVRGQGGVRLLVSRTPVVVVVAIDAAGTAVDPADVVVEDAAIGMLYREAGWPWTAARQPGPSWHPAPGTEAPSIVVTYAGGWVTPLQATPELPRTLPYEIEGAVKQLVLAAWHRRGKNPHVIGESFEGSTFTFDGQPVPATVMAALSPHVRIANA